ncbi:RRM Nup35-type domain-containing protein [Pseudozyma hubeiensis]|nr:RRM Nup35-type domain-containing protein [Pseudozyma hubeiensis]
MFSFSNPSATPQQPSQQQQQPQQQPTSTPFGGSTGGFNNSFSTPGGFSLGNSASNSTTQQQSSQQQQQGTPQSSGFFGQKPMFGTPGAQQPQQQQNTGSLFGNNSNAAPNAGQAGQHQPQPQQQTNLFGTPQNNNMFGSSASSGFGGQQQPQQQQSSQPNSFGPGSFGFNSSSPAPFSAQQQQQQPQQNQSFGSPYHHPNAQQQQQHQQQQPNSFQHNGQPSQQQQQAIEQQRFNLEQQSQNMSYIPGYLSRTKVVKPYKLPVRQAEPTSPEATQDADTSIAFGTPASKSGKEDSTPSSKGQASPVGRFSSTFFNDRRDDASFSRAGSVGPGTPWRGGKESIFGAGGLRGGHQSATPAPQTASATPARKTSTESPVRTSRSTSTPPAASSSFSLAQGAIDQDDDEDAPPQERLEDEASAAAQSSFLGPSSGSSFANNFRNSPNPDSSSAQSLGPGRSGLSTPSAHTLQQASPLQGLASSNDGASSSASAEKTTALGMAQRTVLLYGYPTWMEKVVLELFASIGGVEVIEAIDLTGSGSAQEQATAQPSSPSLSCCTRLRYSESFQALHALRRNGEVVAGACMVGVRWEDDNFHQVALTNGVDAVFRMDVFPSSRTAETYKASSKSIAVPAIDAASGASAFSTSRSQAANSSGFAGVDVSNGQRSHHSIAFGQGGNARSSRNETGASSSTGAASGGSNVSYPAFGRPLSVINDPSIAFKPSASTSNLGGIAGSPFKAASSLFGSSAAAGSPKPALPATGAGAADNKPGGVGASTSVLGRITDGIFGW